MEATSRSRSDSLGFCLLTFLTFLSFGCAKQGVNQTNSVECASNAMATSFLVKWHSQVPQEYKDHVLTPGSLITRFDGINKIHLEENVLNTHAGEFEYAEHNFKTRVESLDPAATSEPVSVWGPQDIETAEAWAYLGKKGKDILVAVVDSGVDINHPQLQSQLWTNPSEVPGDGKDNDKNGLIDDLRGWNFGSDDADVDDHLGHGTHIAGVVAGQLIPTAGFTGIAPEASILPIKFIDDRQGGTMADAVRGVDYAVSKGAKVINASWGGPNCGESLRQVILKSVSSGVVFVSAAGNSGVDISKVEEWPAGYQVPGKITVGAYSKTQILAGFSNYGALVDLAAPGQSILSTYIARPGQSEGQLAVLSGTSMAAPFVSGVAALLLSAKPDASPSQVVDALNAGVVVGKFGVRTSGKLNALGAARYFMTH